MRISDWSSDVCSSDLTVVLKPSEFTSASTLEFVKLFEEAGFPPGVVNVVTGFGKEVGEPLVAHPKVAKVAFTGGGLSGQKVYETAIQRLKAVHARIADRLARDGLPLFAQHVDPIDTGTLEIGRAHV